MTNLVKSKVKKWCNENNNYDVKVLRKVSNSTIPF